jgi:hypothetical protein
MAAACFPQRDRHALAVDGIALLGTPRSDPWYAPQVLIPLLGIILGNIMNGVSVSLNALSTAIMRERSAIEARLALGTDRSRGLPRVHASEDLPGHHPWQRDHAGRRHLVDDWDHAAAQSKVVNHDDILAFERRGETLFD